MNQPVQISKELAGSRQESQTNHGAPAPGEMELINKHSRRKLSAAEVFVFSVVLCDNEIDRDFERFTIDALHGLSRLFVGKTGIFDHSMKGRDQLARVFSCEVEEEPGRVTAAGEAYHRLKARAYLPRIAKNEEIILEIDAGIKKEVSVGCAVGSPACSICGAPRREGGCAHVPGREYVMDGKKSLCHTLLDGPTDAFEWSFVAVPAQRNAGIVKSFPAAAPAAAAPQTDCPQKAAIVPGAGQKPAAPAAAETDFREKAASPLPGPVSGIASVKKALTLGEPLTREQGAALLLHLERLEEGAADGERYQKSLRGEVLRLSALCNPEFSGDTVKAIVERLPAGELEQMRDAYRAWADRMFPAAVQLPKPRQEEQSNHNFMI